jgi:hypothetical protein
VGRSRLARAVHFVAVAPDSVWEIVFLMVILKIPIGYLCFVIWYAVKAKPEPEQGAGGATGLGHDDDGSGGTRRRMRPRHLRPGPHGGPSRSYPRVPRTATVSSGKRRQ